MGPRINHRRLFRAPLPMLPRLGGLQCRTLLANWTVPRLACAVADRAYNAVPPRQHRWPFLAGILAYGLFSPALTGRWLALVVLPLLSSNWAP